MPGFDSTAAHWGCGLFHRDREREKQTGGGRLQQRGVGVWKGFGGTETPQNRCQTVFKSKTSTSTPGDQCASAGCPVVSGRPAALHSDSVMCSTFAV